MPFVKCNIFITFEMVKCSDVFRVLKKDGWYVVRQRGSHMQMKNPIKEGTLNFPFHGAREMRTGVYNKILKDAKIYRDEKKR